MIRIKLLITFMSLGLSISLFAQTDPLPHTLANGKFFFDGFGDPGLTEYPVSMQGWTGAIQSLTPNTPPPTGQQATGDAELFPSTQDYLSTTMKNEGSGGISIRGGNNATFPLAFVVALNTMGAKKLHIKWKAIPIHSYVNVTCGLGLQYRIGNSGPWTNVDSNNYLLTPAKQQAGLPEYFEKTLPSSLEEKPLVQFRWLLYYVSGALIGTTNRPGVDSIQITTAQAIPQAPQADFLVSNSTPMKNEPVNFTDQSTGTPTSWYWDFGDGDTSTVQNPVKAYSADGVYTVQLIATNSVGSDTMTKVDYITIGSTSGLGNISDEVISVYPNPGSGVVRVIAPVQPADAELRIYNMLGELVYESFDIDFSKELDLSSLKKGTYLLQLGSNEKVCITRFSLL